MAKKGHRGKGGRGNRPSKVENWADNPNSPYFKVTQTIRGDSKGATPRESYPIKKIPKGIIG